MSKCPHEVGNPDGHPECELGVDRRAEVGCMMNSWWKQGWERCVLFQRARANAAEKRVAERDASLVKLNRRLEEADILLGRSMAIFDDILGGGRTEGMMYRIAGYHARYDIPRATDPDPCPGGCQQCEVACSELGGENGAEEEA